MQRVSMMRISSSRATTAAGTSPPRVTATIPVKGPASIRRQASALAVRCSSSQVTGKFFCGTVFMLSFPGSAPPASSRQLEGQPGQLAGGRAQLVEDREVVAAGDRQQGTGLVRRGAPGVQVAAVGDQGRQLVGAVGDG